MKKSLTYKKKFYLLLLATFSGVVLIVRRFVIPTIQMYSMAQNSHEDLSLQTSASIQLNELNKVYNQKEDALGVSDDPFDLLQIEVLTNLESCASSKDLNVDIVETQNPERVMEYDVFFSTYAVSGSFPSLLKLLDCMEKELSQGVISSVKIEKNEKNIELKFTVQNITSG